jgi:dTDP-4-dehydrorhamnose reductase
MGHFVCVKIVIINIVPIAEECGGHMVYISTDYVFDGTSPPYADTDKPNPLNIYGKLKLEGEEVVLKESSGIKSYRVSRSTTIETAGL